VTRHWTNMNEVMDSAMNFQRQSCLPACRPACLPSSYTRLHTAMINKDTMKQWASLHSMIAPLALRAWPGQVLPCPW
jgi:hypothetical protein